MPVLRYPFAFLVAAAAAAQNTLAPVADRAWMRVEGLHGFYDAMRGRPTFVGGRDERGALPSYVPYQIEGRYALDGLSLAASLPFPGLAFGATAADALGSAWIFGGIDSSGASVDQFWRWDPTIPRLVPVPRTAPWPSARHKAALAVLPGGAGLVLFGGVDASGPRNDTWVWSNDTWTQLTPSTAPAARAGHAMTFAPALNAVLLFGGQAGATVFGDSWTFAGTTWSPFTAVGPSARYGHAMATDYTSGDVVLVGGEASPASQGYLEGWVLRGATWTSTRLPEAAVWGQLVHDAGRRQMLFGGGSRYLAPPFNWRAPNSQLAAWDGTVWSSLNHSQGGQIAVPIPNVAPDIMTATAPTRSRITRFGGQDGPQGPVTNATWDLGVDIYWARRTPTLAPSARRYGGMAGGPAGVFQFGGEDGLGQVVSDDLWQYDGSNWSIRPAAGVRPPRRTYAALAYDAARGRLVTYGGLDQAGNALGDCWEFDLASNTWLVGAGRPPSPRMGVAMTFDAAVGAVLVHGGQRPGVVLSSETWAYDARGWRLLSNAGPALQQASIAFDPNRNLTLLIGGYFHNGSGLQTSPQFWALGAGVWTRLADQFAFLRGLAYDPSVGACVGFQSVFSSIAPFYYDGSDWQTYPLPTLSTRVGQTFTFEPSLGRSLLIGGSEADGARSDTWSFDGRWWNLMQPSHRLPRRVNHAAAWSPSDGGTLLFGGEDGATLLGDTWLLEASAARWRQLLVPGPGPRRGHAMCTEESTGRVVLFGGRDAGAALDDTWRWDGTAWATVGSSFLPVARAEHAMAWHAGMGQVVMFGGTDGTSLFNDTWAFSPTLGWRPALQASRPPARYGHTLTYDASRARVLMVGGLTTGGLPLRDMWEFDGVDWTPFIAETGPPPSLLDQASAWDPLRGRVHLSHGGSVTKVWSNVSPAGVGDPTNRLALTYRSQPFVGEPFRMSMPLPRGIGVLMLSDGPAITPMLLLPPPIGCGTNQLYMPLSFFYLFVSSPEFALPIPDNPSFPGTTFRFQGLTYSGSCWTATDPLNVVMQAR